jgi:signal peptidase II
MRKIAASRDLQIPGLWHQVQSAPFLALVALEVDQLTKLWVRESLPLGEAIPHDSWLRITHVVNPGIFLGVPASPTISLLLPSAMIFASLILYWRLERSNDTLLNLGTGLFVGGSLGNLVDRIAYGHVTDFIELITSGGHVRTIFNVADLCAILGIVILEVFLIRFIIRLILKKGLRYNPVTPYMVRLMQKRRSREK